MAVMCADPLSRWEILDKYVNYCVAVEAKQGPKSRRFLVSVSEILIASHDFCVKIFVYSRAVANIRTIQWYPQ
jgi:hypothetical protein